MRYFLYLILMLSVSVVKAETIDLARAIELALSSDPRIEEKKAFVKHAQALYEQANSSGGIRVNMTTFLAVTTGVDGGFYQDGSSTCTPNCEPRSDAYDFDDGFSLWAHLEGSVIKPISTFGRLENYQKAAESNVLVKNEDIVLQQDEIRLDVVRAYNGYLTARDSRFLIEATIKRLSAALDLINEWLEEGKGEVNLSDRYALEAGMGLLERFKVEASGLESIAIAGLSVLTGLDVAEIKVADKRLRAAELPEEDIDQLVKLALDNRPEFKQLDAGLSARRALVEAQKSENKPVAFVGVAGSTSYSPGRDSLNNPHIYDPFNHTALTPMVGMTWSWEGAVADAKVDQAKAELNALIHKSSFAQRGVPFQVSEQFHTVHSLHQQMAAMKDAAKSARRWMVASYTDFEAGLEEADKIIAAMQMYVLAYADYLKIMNDYNNSASKLKSVTGNYNEF
ncbi:MAG: TolC family protein [Gammaproteobacteria bacterium]|nr:TolC family protein [Gammaproteobacteria bacterium]